MANGIFRGSFRRAYREDLARELEVPGVMHHILYTFKMIFASWRVLLPLLVTMVVVGMFLMGAIDGATLKDAGALVIVTVMMIVIWLTTIFTLRHRMAGQKVSFSDAIFNAMAPMNAVVVLIAFAAIQAVPVILVVISYSAAVETHFLDTPFYAFLFLMFAGIMFLLSGYLLSSTVMAMVAVSAPGIYPIQAVKAANEVMRGRRIRFVLRLIVLLMVLFIMWVIVVWPMAALLNGTVAFSVVLMSMGCASVIFVAAYFYLYYRWMINFDNEKEKNEQKRRRK